MPEAAEALTPAQQAVVSHRGGPLLVIGAAGTGKTRTLVHRHAWLRRRGRRGARAGARPDGHRGRRRRACGPRSRACSTAPSRSSPSTPCHGFCARLLHDEALEAGLDPFVSPVTAADRLAMLLDRVDELTLRVHDFRGNPAALLADVIARIDRLKAA